MFQTDRHLVASLFRRVLRTIPKNKKEYEQKKVGFFLLIVAILLSAALIGRATYVAYQYLTHLSASDMLALLSQDLKVDDKGRTNVLLLGEGGEGHDGEDLTDTIIIASLHAGSNPTAGMVSIPRDLWIDIPGYRSSRINKIYENLKDEYGSASALDILRQGVETVSGIEIPYVIKVDFTGFIQVIDTLGGIEITVDKSIADTAYPNDTQTGYESFHLEAGTHILDGATALKYARSRHSTSDFDRSRRQQQILQAVRKRAEEVGLIRSPLKLMRLSDQFANHVETNMKLPELLSLAQAARQIDSSTIGFGVLKDQDLFGAGSFLSTPDRELYGGAYVLIPLDNSYIRIQRFINLIFDFPEFFHEKASIQILNGTKEYALASSIGQKLIPYGFQMTRYANAEDRNFMATHYYIHHPERTRVTEEVLKLFFPKAIKVKTKPPAGMDTSFDLTIVLGMDAKTIEW